MHLDKTCMTGMDAIESQCVKVCKMLHWKKVLRKLLSTLWIATITRLKELAAFILKKQKVDGQYLWDERFVEGFDVNVDGNVWEGLKDRLQERLLPITALSFGEATARHKVNWNALPHRRQFWIVKIWRKKKKNSKYDGICYLL